MEDSVLQPQLSSLQTDIREIRRAIDNLRENLVPSITSNANRISIIESALFDKPDNIHDVRRKTNIMWFVGKSMLWLGGFCIPLALGILFL